MEAEIHKKTGADTLSLLRAITKAKDEERLSIARELHDSPIQELVAILYQLEGFINMNQQFNMASLRFFWQLESQLRMVLKDLRHFSQKLRPSMIEHMGLTSALEYLKHFLWNNYGIKVHIVIIGTNILNSDVELHVFRIIQEGLNNIAKHSGAQEAEVILETGDNTIIISIKDQGRGFKIPTDNWEQLSKEGKMGLLGMQERINVLDGNLNIESTLGKGTSVNIHIPVVNLS